MSWVNEFTLEHVCVSAPSDAISFGDFYDAFLFRQDTSHFRNEVNLTLSELLDNVNRPKNEVFGDFGLSR